MSLCDSPTGNCVNSYKKPEEPNKPTLVERETRILGWWTPGPDPADHDQCQKTMSLIPRVILVDETVFTANGHDSDDEDCECDWCCDGNPNSRIIVYQYTELSSEDTAANYAAMAKYSKELIQYYKKMAVYIEKASLPQE